MPEEEKETSWCLMKICHTLEYYTSVGANLLSNKRNISLLFFEGVHTSNFKLNIKNTERVLLTTLLLNNESGPSEAGLRIPGACLWNIKNLEISRLQLSGSLTVSVWVVHMESGSFFQLGLVTQKFEVMCQTLTITRSIFTSSTIQSSLGRQNVMHKPTTSSSIMFIESTFIKTNISNVRSGFTNWSLEFLNCSIEAAPTTNGVSYIQYDLGDSDSLIINIKNSRIDVQLQFSIFGDYNSMVVNIIKCFSFFLLDNGLIEFVLNLAEKTIIDIYLSNVHIENKLAEKQGTFVSFDRLKNLYCCDFNFTLINSTIIRKNIAVLLPVKLILYRGVKDQLCRSTYSINITNTHFVNNSQCVSATIPTTINFDVRINITNSHFKFNERAVAVEKKAYSNIEFDEYFNILSSLSLSIEGSTFYGNTLEDDFIGIVNALEITVLLLRQCQFIQNTGTAVAVISSTAIFEGNNVFINNTGERGGAIALHYSTTYVKYSTSLLFINNTANQVGGAIYVEENEKASYKCFIQSVSYDLPLPVLRTIVFTFINNTATKGGDDLYGTGLRRRCHSDSYILYNSFTFKMNNVGLSSISSNPTRICLCNHVGIPQCLNMDYIYRKSQKLYPGELLTISAVIVGYDLGTTQGVVYSQIKEYDSKLNTATTIPESLHVQEVNEHRRCTMINLAIQSNEVEKNHTIQITAGQATYLVRKDLLAKKLQLINESKSNETIIDHDIFRLPISLVIYLEDCPVGFHLSNTPPYICTCHSRLVEIGITLCTIVNHTGLIFRSGTTWISSSGSVSFIVHQYCPYGYCDPDNSSVNLRLPDTQCALKHSGVLCGGCQSNLSLVLGSSKCLPCSNKHLSLLPVFIVTGFTLVIFIKALDLTVSRSTINGLIFFANIIWTNKSILFPTTNPSHFVLQILHTFIAWLNLDLGIETCFFDGLDAYWKTWMQFLFPIYVWTITGVIILVSRYSTRASKLFGNNSVPVLATLILLSYSKLLRTIITAFGFSILEYPNSTQVVWSFDGNIAYFGAPHAILFLASLTALLLLWLPFTSVLLTYQCLRRKSHLRPLHWVNRWRPFFDAYLGQLKPKQQYWVGLLLVVRALLLVMFAVTSAVIPRINILAIAVVGMGLFTYCMVFGMAYKSVWLSLLEMSFIMNVTLLAILKPYTQSSYSTDIGVTYTAIGITFLQFITIAIHRFCCQVKHAYTTYKRRHTNNTYQPPAREMKIVPQIVHMHYREPLLESGN